MKYLSGQLSLKRALLTTDEAVKKEIMKNTSILRSDLKKEDFNIFYKSSSFNGNEEKYLDKNNESSLIENSQIKMYKRDTLSPIFSLNKKGRNKNLVDNIISKINSSSISNNSNNRNSLNSIDKYINNKNNINNDFSSRKGILYNGSFKGSKNNNIYPEYTIKVNSNSFKEEKNSKKNNNLDIDTTINPFNNYLLYKNSNIRLSSKKSAFFGKDKLSNYKKTLSNQLNNEESENNINNNINDKSSNSVNEINDISSQNIKIYNVKKNNNFYLLLK